MRTLIAMGHILIRLGTHSVLFRRSFAAWLVQMAAVAQLQDGERGLLGPMLAVLAVIALNGLMLAFALRLRRHIHSIGERNEEE